MENIISWTKDLESKPDVNTGLYATYGERYQFFVHKTYLGEFDTNEVTLGLVSKDKNGNPVVIDLKEGDYDVIRKQESDKYYVIEIVVSESPTSDLYKQFALTRPNGEVLLGTFKSQQTDLDKYIDELALFYESYPHTRVDVFRKGNVLRLHVYQNTAMKINGEKISVGLGNVTERNVNTPAITARLVNASYVVPDEITYKVGISENINEGNIFRVGDVSVVALSSDTPSTILQKLGVDTIKVRTPNTPDVQALNGSFQVGNTINPSVTFEFVNNVSGNDTYYIDISDAQNGNEINIYWQTGSTGWRLVQGLSSTYTIEDWIEDTFYDPALTPKRFKVPTGSVLTVGVRRGVRVVQNTNNPSFVLEILNVIPSRTVKAYTIDVGGTVRRGNEFIIRRLNASGSVENEFSYIAKDGDTLDSVNAQIPLELDGYYYASSTGSLLTLAKKGNPFGPENITDVSVLSQPRQYRSNYYVANFKINPSIPVGIYQFCICEKDKLANIISVGNSVNVTKLKHDSTVLTFGDEMDAFGVQYYESGLTQTLRLPIFLKNKKPVISEEEVTNINKKVVSSLTSIQYTQDFDSRAFSIDFVNALVPLMKGKNTYIGSDKVKFTEIEVGDELGVKRNAIVKGKVVLQDQVLSNFQYASFNDNSQIEKATFEWKSDGSVTNVTLKSDKIIRVIDRLDNVIQVPLNAYSIRFWVVEPCIVRLYKNKDLIKEYEVTKPFRYHRIENYTRFDRDDMFTFVAERYEGSEIVINAEFNELYNSDFYI